MKFRPGRVLFMGLIAGVAMSAAPVAQAQQNSHPGPSKYLYLSTMSLKPGSMAQYAKLAQEQIAAMREAKAPGHFFTMEQITGSGMLISIHGFDSFAGLQKAHDERVSNTQLMTKLRANSAAIGAMVRESHDSIYVFRKDLSLHSDQSLADMRFMRMTVVQVKPGHVADLENIAKAEVKAQGANADVHWAVFQKIYGRGSGVTFIVATPMKSLADVDTMIANRHKTREMVGEGLANLVMSAEAKSTVMDETDLFVFAPKLSYMSDSLMKASPDFWGKQ